MKNLSRITALFLLIAVIVSSFVLSAHAAKLTDAEYADLFKRASGPPVEGITAELENAFIADPLGFIKALSKENYGTMYSTIRNSMGGVDWANDPNRTEHRDALLSVAGAGNLTQPQRRVVKWLLIYTDLAKDYKIFTDEIDYPELFSHVLSSDATITNAIDAEIMAAFDRDGITFLRALALESSQIRSRVTDTLAITHYFENNNHGKIGEAMKFLEGCDDLGKAEQQIITDFWAQIDMWENPPPTTLPPIPTPPPPTQPTTQALTASLSFDKHFFVTGEPVPIRISTNGQNCQLQITHPDGSLQTITPDEGQSVITLTFGHAGTYYIALTVQRGAERYTTDSVNIIVDAQPLSGPTTPSTTPKPIPEEKPLNIPTPWIIIGLVAVIFGVQAVAIVLYRKKSTPAEEDFDE